MIINHNIAALNTLNHLNAATNAQSKAMQKLSSGLRINSAADDAAGLAISEKMRGQIRGLDQATSNAQDGSSLIQTAEGALNETTDILQRMRELATQAANDTNTADDREQIQKEMNQLTSEINRIGNTTEFNTQKLLDGNGKEISVSTTTAGVAATSGTKGQYTIDLTGLANGNKVTIDGNPFDFDTDANTTAQNISKDKSITDKYEVAVNGSKITLTQKTASDTQLSFTPGADVANTVKNTVDTAGVAPTEEVKGVYTFDLDVSKLKDGQTIKIDDNEYTYKADGTGDFQDAAELATRISSDGDYTATQANGTFTLTQSTGSATAPDVSIEAKGFTATFQIGANTGQTFGIQINDMRSKALQVSGDSAGTVTVTKSDGTSVTAKFTTTTDVSNGTDSTGVESGLDVSTAENASNALSVIDKAIQSVSSERAKLGAYENRLDHTVNNLTTSSENLTSAESRIRDVDYALAA